MRYQREDLVGISVRKSCSTCRFAYFHWDGTRGVCFEHFDENRNGLQRALYWWKNSPGCPKWKVRVIQDMPDGLGVRIGGGAA